MTPCPAKLAVSLCRCLRLLPQTYFSQRRSQLADLLSAGDNKLCRLQVQAIRVESSGQRAALSPRWLPHVAACWRCAQMPTVYCATMPAFGSRIRAYKGGLQQRTPYMYNSSYVLWVGLNSAKGQCCSSIMAGISLGKCIRLWAAHHKQPPW